MDVLAQLPLTIEGLMLSDASLRPGDVDADSALGELLGGRGGSCCGDGVSIFLHDTRIL